MNSPLQRESATEEGYGGPVGGGGPGPPPPPVDEGQEEAVRMKIETTTTTTTTMTVPNGNAARSSLEVCSEDSPFRREGPFLDDYGGGAKAGAGAALDVEFRRPFPLPLPPDVRPLLLVSHFLSRLAETTWQFVLVLLLSSLPPPSSSLALVSSYGLAAGSAVALCGGRMGRLLDDMDRLGGMRAVLAAQYASVSACTVAALWLLEWSGGGDGASPPPSGSGASDSAGDDGESRATLAEWTGSLPPAALVALALVHVLGPAADLFGQSTTVALEKDWVVVLSRHGGVRGGGSGSEEEEEEENLSGAGAGSGSSGWLRRINVAMRRIDLGCKMGGPAIAGLAASDFGGGGVGGGVGGLRTALLLSGLVSVLSVVAECVAAGRMYRAAPGLASRRRRGDSCAPGTVVSVAGAPTEFDEEVEVEEEDDDEFDEDEMDNGVKDRRLRRRCPCVPSPRCCYRACPGLRTYLSQPCSPYMLALALVYLNVLSVGDLMTSFLLNGRGMSPRLLGLWRGAASVMGLMGTASYDRSAARCGLKNTALWSSGMLAVLLGVSYAALFDPSMDGGDGDGRGESNAGASADTALGVLVVTICLSRVGMWTFDLAVSQLMQETVDESVRGAVGGTQQSLQSFFQTCHFALGLAMPDPDRFGTVAGVGYGAVVAAFGLVAAGVCRNRDI